MGKKRIITKTNNNKNSALKNRALSKASKKKKYDSGVLNVESTYNNTRVSFMDFEGNLVFASSAGSLGFKGAKKGTAFAAAKAGELIGEQAYGVGVRNVDIKVKGVGQGRESAIRGFISKGIDISEIKDVTPIPHNGVRKRKPRRV